MLNLIPCATCPWRVDKDASTIPAYSHAKACGLLSTVGEGDGFRKIMACHHSAEAEPYACLGYVAREGWSNISVRLMLAKGELPSPDQVQDACDAAGVELHEDYPAVLRKLSGGQMEASR